MVKLSEIPEEFRDRIMNGRAAARAIKEELRRRISSEVSRGRRPPRLVVILVGDNEASEVYVRQKQKSAGKIGMDSVLVRMDGAVPESELLAEIGKHNADDSVDGLLVQLPLPPHIDESKVIVAVSPGKDVDGFHPMNMGRFFAGMEDAVLPCTPQGCMFLLKGAGVEFRGRKAVIVGRSNIVGKPVAMMLMAEHATVTMCHSRTRDLAGEIGRADILVAAAGKPEIIRGEWIKEGAAVVDVGINRTPGGKLVGDVEFRAALERAAHITPVPGGVGPMTVAMLMKNTVDAWLGPDR